MRLAAAVLVLGVIGASAILHPVAVASSVLLAAALLPTVDRRTVTILLVGLVLAQDVGLRIDAAAPAAHGHEPHA